MKIHKIEGFDRQPGLLERVADTCEKGIPPTEEEILLLKDVAQLPPTVGDHARQAELLLSFIYIQQEKYQDAFDVSVKSRQFIAEHLDNSEFSIKDKLIADRSYKEATIALIFTCIKLGKISEAYYYSKVLEKFTPHGYGMILKNATSYLLPSEHSKEKIEKELELMARELDKISKLHGKLLRFFYQFSQKISSMNYKEFFKELNRGYLLALDIMRKGLKNENS
jgi:hypothetical protein